MKPNLGSILTAVREPTAEIQAIVESWRPAAKMVYALSPTKPSANAEINWVRSVKEDPTLSDVLRLHMTRFRGYEKILLCAPNIQIDPDFGQLDKITRTGGMQNTWAFRFVDNEEPIAFVFTSNLLPQVFFDLDKERDGVKFSTGAWATWFHTWATKRMMNGKYADATSLGLVKRVNGSSS